MDSLEKFKYPIGPFKAQELYTYEDIRNFIKTLEKFPKNLRKLLNKLSKQQLNTPYRPGGWTVRQVIHHLADSHMNAYIRMKLAVTETTPVVKAYEEALWAETADGKDLSPKVSLNLLKALHKRWIHFLNSLQLEDLETGYFHPEKQRIIPLPEAIALYAWHAKHHLAHIKLVLEGIMQAEEHKQPESGRESAVDTPKAAPKRRGRKPSAKAPEETPKRPGRPKKETAETTAAPKRPGRPKATDAGAAPQKTGRPKKTAAKTTGEAKLTRAEALEKARAARTAKKTAPEQPAAEQPAAPKKAGRPKKTAAKTAGEAKLTRAEALEKARAARTAKKTAPEQPAAEQPAAPKKAGRPKKTAAETAERPKLSRAEVLEKARAARTAKKAADQPATEQPAAPKKPGRPKAQSFENEKQESTAGKAVKSRAASPTPAAPKTTTRKTKKQ